MGKEVREFCVKHNTQKDKRLLHGLGVPVRLRVEQRGESWRGPPIQELQLNCVRTDQGYNLGLEHHLTVRA